MAKRAGGHVAGIYEDNGISGAKGREARPSLDALLKDAGRRKFNLVAAWSVDRLGRSLQDLHSFLAELHALGCDLYLDQQAVDTSTPAGRAVFQMLEVFAEFGRPMIRDRVLAGLARARAQGKRLGRPLVVGEGVDRAAAALAGGASLRRAAAIGRVSLAVVRRLADNRTGTRSGRVNIAAIHGGGDLPPHASSPYC